MDGFGLVEPYGRLRQGVVEGVPDRAGRGHESSQSESFPEPHGGVLRARVAVEYEDVYYASNIAQSAAAHP